MSLRNLFYLGLFRLVEPPDWFGEVWSAFASSHRTSDLGAYVIWWALELIGAIGLFLLVS